MRKGRSWMKTLRFSSNQSVLANVHQRELQEMADRLSKISTKYFLKINIKKTKIMKISKGKETAVNVIIDGQLMEQIGKFC